jgi:heme ABC exporter ATP-binding subunit CcmA
VVALVDRFPVLAGVNFEASAGEVVALTGPNGAGKTSLLRVLAGVLAIHEGTGSVLGIELKGNARALKGRVMLSGHQPFLYSDLTATENVRFLGSSSAKRISESEANEALDAFGLKGRAHVAAGRLSAGQRRRIGLALIKLRKPELLLADEPHSGLDVSTRELLDGLIGELASSGTTVVFSSHEADVVERVAQRVVEVSGGITKELANVR